MKSYVQVKTRVAGFHCWPQAPEPVTFLRERHRHLFGVRAKVEVGNDDRAVEFFMLKRDVQSVFDDLVAICGLKQSAGFGIEFGSMSCEMIARMVGDHLQLRGYKVHDVEVDEDGENSGIVSYAGGANR